MSISQPLGDGETAASGTSAFGFLVVEYVSEIDLNFALLGVPGLTTSLCKFLGDTVFGSVTAPKMANQHHEWKENLLRELEAVKNRTLAETYHE